MEAASAMSDGDACCSRREEVVVAVAVACVVAGGCASLLLLFVDMLLICIWNCERHGFGSFRFSSFGKIRFDASNQNAKQRSDLFRVRASFFVTDVACSLQTVAITVCFVSLKKLSRCYDV